MPLLATALAVAVGEAALRIGQYGYLNAPVVSDPVLHHVHPRNYVFRSYDPKGQFGGHLIRYDGDGVRVDPAGEDAGASAPHRVAVMGDSFVEAVQVPFDDAIVGRMRRAAGARASIRDFGVTGYSPIVYYLQWQRQVRRWKPTEVLVLLYSNDVGDDRGYDAVAAHGGNGLPVSVPGPADNPLVLMLHRSYIARLGGLAYRRLDWWWQNRASSSGAIAGGYVEENPDITPLTASLLQAFVDEARADGADVTLSAVPSKARLQGGAAPDGPEFADKCKAWAAAHRVRYIDLVPDFKAATSRRLFFDVDIHFTADGNAVAAAAICRSYAALCS